MGNPMLLGNYLAAVAPASWSLLVSVRSWAGSAGAWASAVLIVAGLAATESRSGMAGCLLAGGVWLWLLRRKPSPGAATPAAVGVLTLLLGILIAAGLSGRWKDVVDPDRLAMWTAAWQMALDAPWVGAGPGAYGLRFPYWAHAHSDVLELLADTGLAGGAALMVAVWWASWSCRSAWRSLPEARGIIAACGAGLVALIVSSFGSFPFHHPATAMAAAAYLAMLASFRPCLSAPIHPWLAGALVAGVVGSACIAAAKLGAAAAVSRLVYGFTP
jgi:O-antigen ligase